MKFPNHYPDKCPPEDASGVQGELFRLVSNNPPTAKDFISYYLLGKRFARAKMCQACGLSVYTTEADVKEIRKANPAARKQFVAKARLSTEWGQIAKTGNGSHHTWWVVEGKKPESIFDVIEME